MPANIPDWQQLALYAVGAALLLILLQRIPYVGRIVRIGLSFGLLALSVFLLMQMAPYQPFLGSLADRLGVDRQSVTGDEVRIRMSPDGHFWVNATINGVRRHMLIDSGATVTAVSEQTAEDSDIGGNASLMPIMLRTANGLAQARTGTLEELRVGNIVATDLKVVISPALGNLDVLGMNFLSKLQSWRVEGRTLILVPKPRKAVSAGR